MNVKEQILLLLESNRERSLSGQELAEQLGVTRGGIWKAMKSLKEEGYAIEAISNKGYRLLKSPDALSSAWLEDGFRKADIPLPLILKKETGSTNNDLKQLVASGETRDLVLIADSQTTGRGRKGRSFFSPAGTGLYMSFLLHPKVNASMGSLLTTLAASAAAKAIEETTGAEALIKWVNDVYVHRPSKDHQKKNNTTDNDVSQKPLYTDDLKKVCGILTECSISMEDLSLDYVIVGIGFNIYDPEGGFPKEIRKKAGSILGKTEKEENLRNRLALQFIQNFMEYYKLFPEISFREEYRKRCFVLGHEISLLPTGCEDIHATDLGSDPTGSMPRVEAMDLDEDFGLIVRHPDGHTETLTTGEISILL